MIVLPQNIQQISYVCDVRTILFFDNSPQKIDPQYKELFVPRNGYIYILPGFVIGFAGFVTFTDPKDLESAGNRDISQWWCTLQESHIYIYMGVKQNVSKFLVWGILTLNKTCKAMIPNCQKKKLPQGAVKSLGEMLWRIFPKAPQSEWGWSRTGWSWQEIWLRLGKVVKHDFVTIGRLEWW